VSEVKRRYQRDQLDALLEMAFATHLTGKALKSLVDDVIDERAAYDQLAARERRMREALTEALEFRRDHCRHSDPLDEMGSPDMWDDRCQRWKAALESTP
jgi:hypothetical protein